MSDENSITAWVSIVIAALALLRPEISNLFRLWRNKIVIYPIGEFEIGFSAFGPTIGISGTFLSTSGDQLIKSVSLKIKRVSDSLSHDFEWAVFRPIKLMIDPQKHIDQMEMASPIIIKKGQTLKFNIQFHDIETRIKCKSILNSHKERWSKYLKENNTLQPQPSTDAISAIYQVFSEKEECGAAEVYSQLDRVCYWEPGEYSLAIIIKTESPDKDFVSNYNFSLTEKDTKNLRSNVIGSMIDICAIPSGGNFYNFQYVQFKPVQS